MTDGKEHLMLIRLSALGDILMTVPVVDALARQYPDTKITMVSRPSVASVFALLPDNVRFVGVDTKEYRGLAGVHRLAASLRDMRPTTLCDLHDVLRTKYIRMEFHLSGIPVAHIHKDRKARAEFIRQQPKRQQVTSMERYAEALEEAGYPIDTRQMRRLFTADRKREGVGIAPFATHQGKIYPLDRMEKVAESLVAKGIPVYIFGGGAYEKDIAMQWEERHPGVKSVVGTFPNIASEADFMQGLHVMVTMDSGNMHLASLTGTPVVSVWGATHPLGGFLGWGQSMDNVIQDTSLTCRPCSTYGNKPCMTGDYRCMLNITPETITDKVLSLCGLDCAQGDR